MMGPHRASHWGDMTERTDAELIAAAADGDEDSFAALFRRHVRPVTGFAVRRARDADAVADIVSETFLIALRQAHRYRPETPTALPWLFGIARRVWIGQHRSRQRITRLIEKAAGHVTRFDESETDAVESAIDASRQRPHLEEALSRLSAAERDVLELVAIHGLSPSEAAVALNISPNAARLRLSRARAHMKELLGESLPGLVPGIDHA